MLTQFAKKSISKITATALILVIAATILPAGPSYADPLDPKPVNPCDYVVPVECPAQAEVIKDATIRAIVLSRTHVTTVDGEDWVLGPDGRPIMGPNGAPQTQPAKCSLHRGDWAEDSYLYYGAYMECSQEVAQLRIEAKVIVYDPSTGERYGRTFDYAECGRCSGLQAPPFFDTMYGYRVGPGESVVYVEYYFKATWNNGSTSSRRLFSEYYNF